MKTAIFVHTSWAGLSSNHLYLGCCHVMYCGSYTLPQAAILIKAFPKECSRGALPDRCQNRWMPNCHQCGTPLNTHFPSEVVLSSMGPACTALQLALTCRQEDVKTGRGELKISLSYACTLVCGFTALTGFWLWEPRFLIFLLSWPGCICLLSPRWQRLQYFWGLRMLPDRPVFQNILWVWSHSRCLHPVLRSTGRYPLPVHRWVALLTAHRPRQRACRYKNAAQISSLLSSRFLWAVWAIVAKCFPICSFLSQNYSLIF